MEIVKNIFTQAQLQELRNLPEVELSYQQLGEGTNKVSFTAALSYQIKQSLLEKMGLDLFSIQQIPMRWIQGDTPSHIDRGQNTFENTYLVYLTDAEGQFHLGNEYYSIEAGSGFSFSEGLFHEVVGTNGTSRLLLGPMSEQGFSVGGPDIEANGATDTVYIRNNSGTTQYRINNGDWANVPFACNVSNSNPDPANNILKVLFTTDITLTNWNHNFWCFSDGIQFGSDTLNTDGSRPIITVNNAPLFRGVFLNGRNNVNGKSDIYIYNLKVVATGTSTLDDRSYLGAGGWICGAHFGRASSNNYIINCSSDGPITDYGGGIVGESAAGISTVNPSIGGSLTIIGCSSTGDIGIEAGGIVGNYAGDNRGSVTCEKCWSEGTIGQNGGGIFGAYAGINSSATATECYSINTIGQGGGGIFGAYASESLGSANASKCYSRGQIQTDAGGIFGRYAGDNIPGGGIATATNCYSSGSITTTGNGIYGSDKYTAGTATSSYSANSSWSDSSADTALQGVPGSTGVGNTWVRITANNPYELNEMGFTPYSTNNINSSTQMIQTYSQSVISGASSVSALISDKSYSILKIQNGDTGSHSTITINSSTGSISTTTATVVGTYTITIRNLGSYNITTFVLTVTGAIPVADANLSQVSCCDRPLNLTGIDYEVRTNIIAGNIMIGNTGNRRSAISYDDIIKMKMAYAAKY